MIRAGNNLMYIPNSSRIALPIIRQNGNFSQVLGTAILLGGNILATAAHVVSASDENLYFGLIPAESVNDFQSARPESFPIFPVKIHKINTLKDICILRCDSVSGPPIPIGDISSVSTGENTLSLGYPHANDGRIVLTQFCGEIGAKVNIKDNFIDTNHFIINIFARPGQSGGPVFVIRGNKAQLIAMVIGSYINSTAPGIGIAGLDPRSLNQTTHAISVTHILEVAG